MRGADAAGLAGPPGRDPPPLARMVPAPPSSSSRPSAPARPPAPSHVPVPAEPSRDAQPLPVAPGIVRARGHHAPQAWQKEPIPVLYDRKRVLLDEGSVFLKRLPVLFKRREKLLFAFPYDAPLIGGRAPDAALSLAGPGFRRV
ncbi:unnamed protein product [Coccothraustes coccothraustes]